jgi:hypothetical protein
MGENEILKQNDIKISGFVENEQGSEVEKPDERFGEPSDGVNVSVEVEKGVNETKDSKGNNDENLDNVRTLRTGLGYKISSSEENSSVDSHDSNVWRAEYLKKTA